MTFTSFDGLGSLINTWELKVPAGCYSAIDFASQLQASLRLSVNPVNGENNFSFTGATISVVDLCGILYLSFTDMKAGSVVWWFLSFTEKKSDLAKIMGYAYLESDRITQNLPPFAPSSGVYGDPTPAVVQCPYPFKYTDTNYILMRSSMAKGGSFTPNVVAQKGSSGSGDVLAKVPMNFAHYPFKTYLSYGVDTPPLIETMFNYNGTEIDTMDIYFTREFDDTPIDFNGLDFSCTIGVWTCRTA